ncbi:MAG TPA: DUF72 domain-containing protein [Candidatus Acidoferrales bacterium]|nr:DUF72 domain-containing protein [Candidatus Acidoferrales bacterium]
MLAFYGERLNAVELNGSFYRTPAPETLEVWARSVPEGFRFCLKAHRGLTYSGPGFDRLGLARQLAGHYAGLGSRRGPLLLQFPPTRRLDPDLLEGLLAALPAPVAVEFRDSSWFAERAYQVLRWHGAALVVTDQEKWPRAPEPELGPLAYYRLRRDYTPAQLSAWARRLRAAAGRHDETYVFLKHEPEAPAWALRLLRPAAAGPARGSAPAPPAP